MQAARLCASVVLSGMMLTAPASKAEQLVNTLKKTNPIITYAALFSCTLEWRTIKYTPDWKVGTLTAVQIHCTHDFRPAWLATRLYVNGEPLWKLPYWDVGPVGLYSSAGDPFPGPTTSSAIIYINEAVNPSCVVGESASFNWSRMEPADIDDWEQDPDASTHGSICTCFRS